MAKRTSMDNSFTNSKEIDYDDEEDVSDENDDDSETP
jgi:hypothetical protein